MASLESVPNHNFALSLSPPLSLSVCVCVSIPNFCLFRFKHINLSKSERKTPKQLLFFWLKWNSVVFWCSEAHIRIYMGSSSFSFELDASLFLPFSRSSPLPCLLDDFFPLRFAYRSKWKREAHETHVVYMPFGRLLYTQTHMHTHTGAYNVRFLKCQRWRRRRCCCCWWRCWLQKKKQTHTHTHRW